MATQGGARAGRRPFKQALVYAILLGWTVWIGFPLYWMLIFPFKTALDVFGQATYIPFVDFTPTARAFIYEAQLGSDAALALTNSVVISIAASCVAVVLGAPAGYGLARYSYRVGPLNNTRVSLFFLSQRMFPVALLGVPYLLMFRTVGLLDTQLAMILGQVGLSTPFVAWFVQDFFVRRPSDVEDSARIDGCSRLQVLRYMVVPLGAPALVAAATLVFLSAWNDYFLAVVVTFSQSITLPLFIQLQIVYLKDVTNWGNVGVVVLVSVLPPLIGGIALQRYLVRGLSYGAAIGNATDRRA